MNGDKDTILLAIHTDSIDRCKTNYPRSRTGSQTDNREQYDKVHCIISNLNFQAEFKYLQNSIVRFLSQTFSNLYKVFDDLAIIEYVCEL
jgi:hypothetical protein